MSMIVVDYRNMIGKVTRLDNDDLVIGKWKRMSIFRIWKLKTYLTTECNVIVW